MSLTKQTRGGSGGSAFRGIPTKSERREKEFHNKGICPICNIYVVNGEEAIVSLASQCFHEYCLTEKNLKDQRNKDVCVKLSNRLKELSTKIAEIFPEKTEFAKLQEVLSFKKNSVVKKNGTAH